MCAQQTAQSHVLLFCNFLETLEQSKTSLVRYTIRQSYNYLNCLANICFFVAVRCEIDFFLFTTEVKERRRIFLSEKNRIGLLPM